MIKMRNASILLIFLLLSFSIVTTMDIYQIRAFRNNPPGNKNPLPRPWYNTTRKEAVIKFILSLQSHVDGGFRWMNPWNTKEGGNTPSSYEALTVLDILNATHLINEEFFMYFVDHLWVEWTYKGTPMGAFNPFIIDNWDFEHSHISTSDTREMLACLKYLGKLDEFIDEEKRARIINFVMSLYDEKTGKFYIGYDEGYLNEIMGITEIWSAVYILYILDALDLIDKDRVAQAVMSFYVCYNDTYGVFESEFGWNVQTRVAIKTLYLLNRLYLVPRDKLINSMKLVYDNTTGGTIDNNPGTLETVLTVLYYLNVLDIINRSMTIDWVLGFQNPFKYGAFAFPGRDPDTTTNKYCVMDLHYINATDVLDTPYKVRDLPPPPPTGPPPESGNGNNNGEGDHTDNGSQSGSNPSNPFVGSDSMGFVFGITLLLGISLTIVMVLKIIEANWRKIRKLMKF